MNQEKLKEKLRELADADKSGDSGGALPGALLELLRGDAESQTRAEEIIKQMAKNHAETEARVAALKNIIIENLAENYAKTGERISALESAQNNGFNTLNKKTVWNICLTSAVILLGVVGVIFWLIR